MLPSQHYRDNQMQLNTNNDTIDNLRLSSWQFRKRRNGKSLDKIFLTNDLL
jgi:hypothetical protein